MERLNNCAVPAFISLKTQLQSGIHFCSIKLSQAKLAHVSGKGALDAYFNLLTKGYILFSTSVDEVYHSSLN